MKELVIVSNLFFVMTFCIPMLPIKESDDQYMAILGRLFMPMMIKTKICLHFFARYVFPLLELCWLVYHLVPGILISFTDN